jgi:putative flavoprotein involved in K+ transport
MLDDSPQTKIDNILAKLEKALAGGDIEAAVNLFQADCYWRDLVTFTWNLKTMEGKDQIRDMLKSRLADRSSRRGASAEGEDLPAEADGITDGWISSRRSGARLRPCQAEGRSHLDAAHDHGRAEGS